MRHRESKTQGTVNRIPIDGVKKINSKNKIRKMNKLLLAFSFVAVMAAACNKQNATPTGMIDEMIDTTASLNYTGMFCCGVEGPVSGTVNVYMKDGKYQLELTDFTVTNGPDLHVYLAKEVEAINFIDLGKLKSTNGNQVYDITGTPDFAMYKYALIYCQQFSVLFGQSELQK